MNKFRTAMKQIRRSPYQALLAILICAMTFFTASLFIYSSMLSSALLSYYEKKPQIIAFFTDKKSREAITALEQNLQSSGKVDAIKYISKEEALNIYREQNKNDPLLLEMVSADILPASLEIKSADIRYLAEIASALKNEPEVEEVIYQKDIIDQLMVITANIRRLGLFLLIFLASLSFLVILTVVGMRVVMKKEEIEILKLVGAGDWHISSPFVIEALLYSGLGVFLGWLSAVGFLFYAQPFLSGFFGDISSLFVNAAVLTVQIWPLSFSFLLLLLGALLLTSFLLSVLGSLISLRRYLR